MKLNELKRPYGRSKSKTKRLGRGDGSGRGGTAGRGHKGQKARAGGFHKLGFEGGQMPLQRRLPKRGFTNIFAKRYAIVNVEALASMPKDAEVTLESLIKRGLIKKSHDGLKVLGKGKLANPMVVKAHAFSAQAKKKIEAAGGKAEVVSG